MRDRIVRLASLFRPAATPAPGVLDDYRTLVRATERRGLLRGGLTLGALTMLTGCDGNDSTAVGRSHRRFVDGGGPR